MARGRRHYARAYKGRRVVLRGKDGVETDVATLEKMVREDFDDIYKEHIEDLQDVAEQIAADATYLVPYETGALESSIDVHVSGSRRYPGIIAHASATNEGYDYALIQEEDETYDHDYSIEGEDRGKDEGSAHYMGGPFAVNISQLFEDIAGYALDLPPELQHAKDYVEGKL